MKRLQILVGLGTVLGDTKSLSQLLLGCVLHEYKMNIPRVRQNSAIWGSGSDEELVLMFEIQRENVCKNQIQKGRGVGVFLTSFPGFKGEI